MADYEYADRRGRTITRSFRIGRAPGKVHSEGRTFHRSYSPSSMATIGKVRSNLHFVCHSQEPWSPGFERYDEHGRGLVDGAREKDRFIDSQNRLADKENAHHRGIRWSEDD